MKNKYVIPKIEMMETMNWNYKTKKTSKFTHLISNRMIEYGTMFLCRVSEYYMGLRATIPIAVAAIIDIA